MKEIDPVSYDIMASSADAISTYNDLKLTSTSLGSFSKFRIRLEDAIEDLIANEIPGGTNDRYLITNLMGKLPALGYQQILMQQDTFFANLTFQETLQKIAKMAVHIERADSASSSGKSRYKIKSSKINNASTERSKKSYKSIKYPSTIAGHKVNSNGGLSPEDWEKLDSDQRNKFMDERAEIAKKQREISALKEELKEAKGSSTGAKDGNPRKIQDQNQ